LYREEHMNRNTFGSVVKTPPSLDEVAKARPRRGNGAPARSTSHKSNIADFLHGRGGKGVLASELYAHPELYGRSPRNRIGELRKAGYLIEGRPEGSSDWFYCLIRDSAGAKPAESSYMKRVREEQEKATPLFGERL
jgi:hypothetical protein